LPITDTRMTRFWITLDQGVDFVLKSLERMVGGEVFVPKIPGMNILDLARAVAPDCRTEIVGVRTGEKLHEVMITRDDARHTVELADYYVIKADFHFFQRRFRETGNGCRPVAEDFEYNSADNPWRLTVDEMRDMIERLEG
jgi:UDP-N-acetylglucosamine 4,6-dehydratase/5-epimerase